MSSWLFTTVLDDVILLYLSRNISKCVHFNERLYIFFIYMYPESLFITFCFQSSPSIFDFADLLYLLKYLFYIHLIEVKKFKYKPNFLKFMIQAWILQVYLQYWRKAHKYCINVLHAAHMRFEPFLKVFTIFQHSSTNKKINISTFVVNRTHKLCSNALAVYADFDYFFQLK